MEPTFRSLSPGFMANLNISIFNSFVYYKSADFLLSNGRFSTHDELYYVLVILVLRLLFSVFQIKGVSLMLHATKLALQSRSRHVSALERPDISPVNSFRMSSEAVRIISNKGAVFCFCSLPALVL